MGGFHGSTLCYRQIFSKNLNTKTILIYGMTRLSQKIDKNLTISSFVAIDYCANNSNYEQGSWTIAINCIYCHFANLGNLLPKRLMVVINFRFEDLPSMVLHWMLSMSMLSSPIFLNLRMVDFSLGSTLSKSNSHIHSRQTYSTFGGFLAKS